jgi:hypothetical protein
MRLNGGEKVGARRLAVSNQKVDGSTGWVRRIILRRLLPWVRSLFNRSYKPVLRRRVLGDQGLKTFCQNRNLGSADTFRRLRSLSVKRKPRTDSPAERLPSYSLNYRRGSCRGQSSVVGSQGCGEYRNRDTSSGSPPLYWFFRGEQMANFVDFRSFTVWLCACS